MKSQKVGGINVRLPHKCKDCGEELNEDGSNFPTSGLAMFKDLTKVSGNMNPILGYLFASRKSRHQLWFGIRFG